MFLCVRACVLNNCVHAVWFSIAMMVLGAALAAANDLSFSARGLVWALANCSATAGYVLYMRKLTRASDLSKFGAVLVNNGIR